MSPTKLLLTRKYLHGERGGEVKKQKIRRLSLRGEGSASSEDKEKTFAYLNVTDQTY